MLTELTEGTSTALSALPTSTGDTAGVFTIWYRDALVAYGYATSTAETKPSNAAQADGVRGRVKQGIARQPGAPLQRRLHKHFPQDWQATSGGDKARARELLRDRGRCRIVRFETGAEAQEALDQLRPELETLLLPAD